MTTIGMAQVEYHWISMDANQRPDDLGLSDIEEWASEAPTGRINGIPGSLDLLASAGVAGFAYWRVQPHWADF